MDGRQGHTALLCFLRTRGACARDSGPAGVGQERGAGGLAEGELGGCQSRIFLVRELGSAMSGGRSARTSEAPTGTSL